MGNDNKPYEPPDPRVALKAIIVFIAVALMIAALYGACGPSTADAQELTNTPTAGYDEYWALADPDTRVEHVPQARLVQPASGPQIVRETKYISRKEGWPELRPLCINGPACFNGRVEFWLWEQNLSDKTVDRNETAWIGGCAYGAETTYKVVNRDDLHPNLQSSVPQWANVRAKIVHVFREFADGSTTWHCGKIALRVLDT